MTYYKDFFQEVLDYIKDADTDATARVSHDIIGRAIRRGIVTIQRIFPESRMDARGRFITDTIPTYTLATAGVQVGGDYPAIPLPDEFIPALNAFILHFIHGMDSRDIKDQNLASYWHKRWRELTGQKEI